MAARANWADFAAAVTSLAATPVARKCNQAWLVGVPVISQRETNLLWQRTVSALQRRTIHLVGDL